MTWFWIPIKTTAFVSVFIYKCHCSEVKFTVSKSTHCSLTEIWLKYFTWQYNKYKGTAFYYDNILVILMQNTHQKPFKQ